MRRISGSSIIVRHKRIDPRQLRLLLSYHHLLLFLLFLLCVGECYCLVPSWVAAATTAGSCQLSSFVMLHTTTTPFAKQQATSQRHQQKSRFYYVYSNYNPRRSPLAPLGLGSDIASEDDHRPPCWYKSPSSSTWAVTTTANASSRKSTTNRKSTTFSLTKNRLRPAVIWKRRIDFNQLQVGDALTDCQIVQELHLSPTITNSNSTNHTTTTTTTTTTSVTALKSHHTGPKVYCDCGVARWNAKLQRWDIVHAMLRLHPKKNNKKKEMKEMSVARKRVARLRKQPCFTAYVSCVRPSNQRFEITLAAAPEETAKEGMRMTADSSELQQPTFPFPATKFSASTLTAGQELVGIVDRTVPFGVFINVGANRFGLLHIKTLAKAYGRFIPPTPQGLSDIAGLQVGGRVCVQVVSNDRQRLFLDLADSEKQREEVVVEVGTNGNKSSIDLAPKELHVQLLEAEDNDDEEIDYQDRKIEDSFGLGAY